MMKINVKEVILGASSCKYFVSIRLWQECLVVELCLFPPRQN